MERQLKYLRIELIITILIVIAMNGTAGNSKLCDNEYVTNKLRKKIHGWMKNAHPASTLLCGNVFWPTCEDTVNIIENITGNNLEVNAYWLMRHRLRNSGKFDSVLILKNMKNGDDWIIHRYISGNEYNQSIDGRSLTHLIKGKFNIKDTSNLKQQLIKKYGYCIHIYSIKIVHYDSTQIDVLIENGTKTIDYPADIKFWSNGEYVVIDIPKIRSPLITKYGLSLYRTIGGIPPDDPRPFIRFGENRIDMRKEAYTHIPDIDKTLENWKKKNNFGGAPVRGYYDGD